MTCPVCYIKNSNYTVNCGSSHTICESCEVQLRMKEPSTQFGRQLKCPICKVVENVSGKRTTFSYEYELNQLYNKPTHIVQDLHCCESGLLCDSMTIRTCSYPDGCSRYICMRCMMCVSHFQ